MLKKSLTLFFLLLTLTGFSTGSYAANDHYVWTLKLKGKNAREHTGSLVNTLASSSHTTDHIPSEPGNSNANANSCCSCCPSQYRLLETRLTMNLEWSELDPYFRGTNDLWLFSRPRRHGLFATTTRHILKVKLDDCSSCCNNFYQSSCCGYDLITDERKSFLTCVSDWVSSCCLFGMVHLTEDFCERQDIQERIRLRHLNDSTSHDTIGSVELAGMSVSYRNATGGHQVVPIPVGTNAIYMERSDRNTQRWLREVIEDLINNESRVVFPGFLHASVRVLLQVTASQQNNSDFTITMSVYGNNAINSIRMEVSKLESGAEAGAGVESGRVTYQIEQLTFESLNMEFTLNRSTGSGHVHTEQPTPSAPLWEPDPLPDTSLIYNPAVPPPIYTPYPDGNNGFPSGK